MTQVDANLDKRALLCDGLTRATPSSVGIFRERHALALCSVLWRRWTLSESGRGLGAFSFSITSVATDVTCQ